MRAMNKGNLRAFCDVRIKTAEGDWVIRGCRVVQELGKRAWLSLPVISGQDADGKVCYKTMLELPSGIKKQINEAAIKAYYESKAIAA